MTSQRDIGDGARQTTLTRVPAALPRRVTTDNLVATLERALERARRESAAIPPTTFSLHDLSVQLLTANAGYRDIAAARLWSAAARRPAGPTLKVAVLSPEDSDMPPSPAWGEAIYHPREIEKLLSDTPFRATYFRDDHLWQIYDARDGFGLQWMRGGASYPPWESGAPLRVFLHWAYRFHGQRLVHAGTLGLRGRGVLLAGKGGAGKSGTVVGGIAAGLQSVGDDYVLLERRPGGARAHPLFPTLKQDADGLRRLGLADSLTAVRETNWQGKYELSFAELGGRPAEQLEIDAIVVPRIARRPDSRFHPLPRSRAMLALAPSGLMQMPGERDSGVSFYSRLVRSLPCFELQLSAEPAEASAAIRLFLERSCRCD